MHGFETEANCKYTDKDAMIISPTVVLFLTSLSRGSKNRQMNSMLAFFERGTGLSPLGSIQQSGLKPTL